MEEGFWRRERGTVGSEQAVRWEQEAEAGEGGQASKGAGGLFGECAAVVKLQSLEQPAPMG